ncbi:hypothetical protein C5B85_17935 [Pseudoclavibacter sp. AY1F1]|nr:hypothetical protein C5B85_17935 [Pseudoclavibacter sp. AY1F1]
MRVRVRVRTNVRARLRLAADRLAVLVVPRSVRSMRSLWSMRALGPCVRPSTRRRLSPARPRSSSPPHGAVTRSCREG